MEIKAVSKSVKISPRKVRIVAELVRGLSVEKALTILSLTPKRGAHMIQSALSSAVANAVTNGKLQKNALYIKFVEVSEGPALKRFHPSTRGRVHPYKKRTSHIKVTLEERSKNSKSQALNSK